MLMLGKVKLDLKLTHKTNMHGTQKPGEPWNKQTVTGPKFAKVKLSVHAPSSGTRYIFYFPSGAWWYLDIYIDRRNDSETR